MHHRRLVALACLAILAAAAWFGLPSYGDRAAPAAWRKVAPGIYRSPGLPAGYALVDGTAALLIDAPVGTDGLKSLGVTTIDGVLLTHHHRDTCAAAGRLLAAGVKVRAPRASAEWLTPAGVRKYWEDALPLRNSRTAYLVVPTGLEGVDCSLVDGQELTWHGWTLRVVATPGHSRDHVAIAVRRGPAGHLVVFAGDALAAPGKLWAPYTTDWDHWTDAGLVPTAASLRKLAGLKPEVLLPAHGPALTRDTVAALTQTADATAEVGFLKSFERFSKQRLGNAPEYPFLAREQAGSAGQKPWSRVSEHLWVTGNTYVLASPGNAILVVDPWGKRSVDQVATLRTEQHLGPVERVLFSHAHYDHYDGIYDLPGREAYQVWSLDEVAKVLADPLYYRAPFVDARPVAFDHRFRDGETARWREYEMKFHHFPGQSYFTMAVETVIDGKRCLFTADNFFHIDLFSGTGGWMGLNRSWPGFYAASARKLLALRPDWVLAEHGGAFAFNAEDVRRRVAWGEAGAKAADALSPTGNHRHDWDPHRVHVEPIVHKTRPGATLLGTLVAGNPLAKAVKLRVVLEGRGLTPDQAWDLDVPAADSARRPITLRLDGAIRPGRHILALRVSDGDTVDATDAFVAVDVER
jgi:glyoxylase-like metal-dependent hydrolase (beta-lactamase superfamily II)